MHRKGKKVVFGHCIVPGNLEQGKDRAEAWNFCIKGYADAVNLPFKTEISDFCSIFTLQKAGGLGWGRHSMDCGTLGGVAAPADVRCLSHGSSNACLLIQWFLLVFLLLVRGGGAPRYVRGGRVGLHQTLPNRVELHWEEKQWICGCPGLRRCGGAYSLGWGIGATRLAVEAALLLPCNQPQLWAMTALEGQCLALPHTLPHGGGLELPPHMLFLPPPLPPHPTYQLEAALKRYGTVLLASCVVLHLCTCTGHLSVKLLAWCGRFPI